MNYQIGSVFELSQKLSFFNEVTEQKMLVHPGTRCCLMYVGSVFGLLTLDGEWNYIDVPQSIFTKLFVLSSSVNKTPFLQDWDISIDEVDEFLICDSPLSISMFGKLICTATIPKRKPYTVFFNFHDNSSRELFDSLIERTTRHIILTTTKNPSITPVVNEGVYHLITKSIIHYITTNLHKGAMSFEEYLTVTNDIFQQTLNASIDPINYSVS